MTALKRKCKGIKKIIANDRNTFIYDKCTSFISWVMCNYQYDNLIKIVKYSAFQGMYCNVTSSTKKTKKQD